MSRRGWAAGTWLMAFALYLATCCPTVYVGDAGELIAGAYSIGVPHPPGYPWFMVLGKAWSVWLPFGNIAFRVNLSTAATAATAVTLAGWVLQGFWPSANRWPWLLGLAFGVSKTFWSQSTQAEVYALHLVFVFAMVGWGWRAVSGGPTAVKYAWWMSLLWGMGLGHHHTLLLLGVLWLAVVWWAARDYASQARWSVVVGSATLVSLGLCVYVLFQFRALANPSMNWGDPDTFEGLGLHVLRKQYGTLSKQPRSWGLMWDQWSLYWHSLTAQWGWWALLPAAGGLAWMARRQERWVWGILALGGLYSLGLIFLLNFKVTPQYEDIMKVFFMPSYLAVLVGIGACLHRLTGRGLAAAQAAVLVGLIAWPSWRVWEENNLGRHLVGYYYGRNMLELPAAPSYLFVAQDNEVFTTAYLKKVERWRDSVTVYDELGCVFDNIYGEYFLNIGKTAHQQRLKTIQRELLGITDRPIYYVLASNYRKFENLNDVQQGMVFTAHPDKMSSAEVAPWRRMETSALWMGPQRQEYLVRDILAQYHLLQGDWYRHRGEREASLRAFQRAGEVGQTVDWVQSNVGAVLMKEGRMEDAIREYERGVELNPRKASAYYDLGIAYNKVGRVEDAIRVYRQALEMDPRYASARNNLGNIYLRQGQVDAAIREYQKGIEADPDNVQAVFNLGGALEELKRFDEAKALYEQALAKHPQYVEAMNNLAGVHLTKGDVGKAVEWYQKAIALKPDYVDARYNLGYAYFLAAQEFARQRNVRDARQWVEQARAQWLHVLRVQPDHQFAKDRLRDADRVLPTLK